MSMEILPMRRVRGYLKMNGAGIPTREIARRLSITPSTVRLMLLCCADASILWSITENVAIGALEQSLFSNRHTNQDYRRHQEPDRLAINHDLPK